MEPIDPPSPSHCGATGFCEHLGDKIRAARERLIDPLDPDHRSYLEGALEEAKLSAAIAATRVVVLTVYIETGHSTPPSRQQDLIDSYVVAERLTSDGVDYLLDAEATASYACLWALREGMRMERELEVRSEGVCLCGAAEVQMLEDWSEALADDALRSMKHYDADWNEALSEEVRRFWL